MELFCGNSQRLKRISCFCSGAPSLMFDRILSVTLSEEIFATGNTKWNLEHSLLPNSLDSHQTQKQEHEILE